MKELRNAKVYISQWKKKQQYRKDEFQGMHGEIDESTLVIDHFNSRVSVSG